MKIKLILLLTFVLVLCGLLLWERSLHVRVWHAVSNNTIREELSDEAKQAADRFKQEDGKSRLSDAAAILDEIAVAPDLPSVKSKGIRYLSSAPPAFPYTISEVVDLLGEPDQSYVGTPYIGHGDSILIMYECGVSWDGETPHRLYFFGSADTGKVLDIDFREDRSRLDK